MSDEQLIRDLVERRESQAGPGVDPSEVVAGGRRRRARRDRGRILAVVGASAALVAGVALGSALTGGGPEAVDPAETSVAFDGCSREPVACDLDALEKRVVAVAPERESGSMSGQSGPTDGAGEGTAFVYSASDLPGPEPAVHPKLTLNVASGEQSSWERPGVPDVPGPGNDRARTTPADPLTIRPGLEADTTEIAWDPPSAAPDAPTVGRMWVLPRADGHGLVRIEARVDSEEDLPSDAEVVRLFRFVLEDPHGLKE